MSLVRNAGDREQVRRAEKKLRERQLHSDAYWRDVLNTLAGRRVMWEILEWCKTFGSIWDPSARIHYNAGQQDIGHRLMARIGGLDERLLFSMMGEAAERERNDKQEQQAKEIEESKSSEGQEPKEE